MNTLIRWNPLRDMLTLQEQMDNLFERPLSAWNRSQWGNFSLDVDVMENDESYVVTASVPGIKQDDLDIILDQNVLTIKGEVVSETEKENEQYHLRERHSGRFSRSIHLPASLEVDAVEANMENGVLTITIPKAEESKPKRISIGNGHHKAIEGNFVE